MGTGSFVQAVSSAPGSRSSISDSSRGSSPRQSSHTPCTSGAPSIITRRARISSPSIQIGRITSSGQNSAAGPRSESTKVSQAQLSATARRCSRAPSAVLVVVHTPLVPGTWGDSMASSIIPQVKCTFTKRGAAPSSGEGTIGVGQSTEAGARNSAG